MKLPTAHISSTENPVSPHDYSSQTQLLSPAKLTDRNKKNCQIAEHLVIYSLIIECFIIAGAQLLAFWVRFSLLQTFGIFSEPALDSYAGYIVLGTVLMLVLLAQSDVYERYKLLRHYETGIAIIKASLAWLIIFFLVTLVFKVSPPVSRFYVALSGLFIVGSLLSWRLIFSKILHTTDTSEFLRHRVLFVGWTEDALRLANTFKNDPWHHHHVMGCVPTPSTRFAQSPPEAIPQLGGFDCISRLIEKHEIDMVILSEVSRPRSEIITLANLCERNMIQFKVLPSFFQILVSGLHLETVNGVPVLGVDRLPLDRSVNLAVKRLMDIVGSLVGLAVSIPLIAVFGLLVYMESPGKILYRQRRLGRRGREFDIIKIRSMVLDAERPGEVGWSTESDERRLKIGSFMRKYNIDELPQFWNVLMGEMSLVGPRPERPELIHNFKEEIPHYNARHNVKPGITGWAQIKGLRGDTDLCERINCDLHYLENWSILLDLQIMTMTFFSRKNAY